MTVPVVQSPPPGDRHPHHTSQHGSPLPADPAANKTASGRAKWGPGQMEGGLSGDGPLFSSMVSSSPPTAAGGFPRPTPDAPYSSSSSSCSLSRGGGRQRDEAKKAVGEVSVMDVRPSHWYNVRHRFSWRAISEGFEEEGVVEEVGVRGRTGRRGRGLSQPSNRVRSLGLYLVSSVMLASFETESVFLFPWISRADGLTGRKISKACLRS